MKMVSPYTFGERDRVVHPGGGKLMTKQEFQKECDVNTIMAKYLANRELPVNIKVGTYGDFASAPDYRDSLHLIMAAKEQFDALPSLTRKKFDNDPEKFLAFVSDEKNLDEAHDLGLLSAEGSKKVVAARDAKVKAAEAAAEAKVRAKIAEETKVK